MGFSLNNLTLFGLVLAIGIVVDDAIVVVEAVEHHIEHGLAPRDATVKAMEQVSGPVVAIGLVLAAVFVPCAFISGITGQFFRQFALTIAVSTVISAFNSLTLSPALAAILLRSREKGSFEALPWLACPPIGAWLGHKIGLHWPSPAWPRCTCSCAGAVADTLRLWWAPIVGRALAPGDRGLGCSSRPLNFLLGWSFRQFNLAFDYSTGVYTRTVPACLRVSLLVLVRLRRPAGPDLVGLHAHADRLHPARTRAICWSTCSCPTPPRWCAREDVVQRIEKIALQDAGRQAHRRHLRAVDPAQRQRLQLRRDVSDARRFRQARPSRRCPATPSPRRLQERLQQRGAGGGGQHLRRAAGRGSGHGRRLQDHRPRPRRQRPGRRCRRTADKVVDGRRRTTRACKACSPASGPTRPGWS